MIATEDITIKKYNFIHDFMNLKDVDKVNKVLLYFNFVLSSDNDTDKKDIKTQQFLDNINGLWVDDRNADEMITDIYSSRSTSYQQRDNELSAIFKQ